MDCISKENSCMAVMSKSTPSATDNIIGQRNEITKSSVVQLKAESQVSLKSSNVSDSEFDFQCKNAQKRITFSPCPKSPNLSLCQTPKHKKNEPVGQTIFEDDYTVKGIYSLYHYFISIIGVNVT